MKKTLFSFLFLVIPAFSFSASPEQPRMPDSGKLMKILYSIPEYQPYRPPGSDSETTDNEIISAASDGIITRDTIKYSLKGDGGIDTPEELFTAVYLIPSSTGNAPFKQAFNVEFPQGKEGYERLICLWLKAGGFGRSNEDAEEYEKAVTLILKAAAGKGISLTRSEAAEYYRKAVSAEMQTIFSRSFAKRGIKVSDSSLSLFLSPWVSHFCAPTLDTRKGIDLLGMAVVDLSEKNPANKPFCEAYDAAVLDFTDEGFQVNYNSDREYYRNDETDLPGIESNLLKIISVLKRGK